MSATSRLAVLAGGGMLFACLAAPAAAPAGRDNAALTYWQAFHFMPRLTKADHKILGDWKTVRLADARGLVGDDSTSLRLLHRAAGKSSSPSSPLQPQLSPLFPTNTLSSSSLAPLPLNLIPNTQPLQQHLSICTFSLTVAVYCLVTKSMYR